jgi:hypothetical protein
MAPESEWCCMHRVLSLQEDFTTKKPMIQHYVESRRHVCVFLPKFHCELNPIELLWGYAKYREFHFILIFAPLFSVNLRPYSGYCKALDGKFATAKVLVLRCLNMCDTLTIWRFFHKTWRYRDAYR